MKSMFDILLVGSDGYIGSNCIIKNVDKCDLKSGTDFLDLPITEYDTIIFLAAAEPSINQTQTDVLYNESLYNKLDEWLQEYPNTHVIFSSSAAIYGETGDKNKEGDNPDPISLYGISKLSGEHRIREYNRHTILRFGNVYGKIDGLSGHGVTEYFQNGGREIYNDGTQKRDFVDIDRIWEVIKAAVDRPILWRGVFNVGEGKSYTINEWYDKWGSGKPEYVEGRFNEIHISVLDNSKMLDRLEAW